MGYVWQKNVGDTDQPSKVKHNNTPNCQVQVQKIIHPASRGVAAHTAGLFRSVRGAKGGVEYEEQSSTGEFSLFPP